MHRPRLTRFCFPRPSRGTLVPLYPTLGGQLGAIAREYGLPSTGGLVLYLVELAQAGAVNPLGDALLGGPRIGEEAWQLLWGQLFEPPRIPDAPDFSRTSSGTGYSEEEEEEN